MSSEKLCNRGVGEENIVLVHPFYFETDKTFKMTPRMEAMVQAYSKKIEMLIRGIDRERFRVVLDDTQSGFKTKTYEWNEEGLLDAVYLDSDGWLAGNEIGCKDFMSSKRNFFAGSYGGSEGQCGGRCVNNVIDGVKKLGNAPESSIILVKDCVLYRDLREYYRDRIFHPFSKGTTLSNIVNGV